MIFTEGVERAQIEQMYNLKVKYYRYQPRDSTPLMLILNPVEEMLESRPGTR